MSTAAEPFAQRRDVVLAVVGSPLAAVVPTTYLVAVVAAALRTSGASRLRVGAAFVTMHLAWGTGFLLGR